MIKNLVSRWTEMVVGGKGTSVILRYSRKGKGIETSGFIACSC